MGIKLIIKKYHSSDFNHLEDCLIHLHDFLVGLDPLERLRRSKAFSPKYTKNLLNNVEKYEGIVLMAYKGTFPVGCVAAVIEQQSENSLLQCIPTKAGRILELYVHDSHRNKGIGTKLMETIELTLKQKKCALIRVEVFAPNRAGHEFYRQLGYQERVIDMVKLIPRNGEASAKNEASQSAARSMGQCDH